VLDLATLEYKPRAKPKFASVEAAKQVDDLKTRLKILAQGADKAGEFYRLFHYARRYTPALLASVFFNSINCCYLKPREIPADFDDC